MYETEEFFSKNGSEMKDILKSCILNYYINNKDKILSLNELQFNESHRIIEATNKQEILSEKGDRNVQATVQ